MMIEIQDNISTEVGRTMHQKAEEVLLKAAAHVACEDIFVFNREEYVRGLAEYRAEWIEYRHLATHLFPTSNPEPRDQIEASWENCLARAVETRNENWELREKYDRAARRYEHEWSKDDRPLAEILKAWAELHEMTWGVRRWLSEQLMTREGTIAGWLKGRPSQSEGLIRKAMEAYDRNKSREIRRKIPEIV